MSRKKNIGKIVGIVVLVIVIIVAGAWIAIHTGPVNHYLLALAERKAGAALGTTVHIGSVHVAWTSLSVKVLDITVDGRGGVSNPPFATIQEADAGVEIGPLLHRKVHLSSLTIEKPVVYVFVDAQGNSNLPHPPASRGPRTIAVTTLLNLQVRDFRLRSGEVAYQDQKLPLSAELHNLHSLVTFNSRHESYLGSLAYDSGRIAAKRVSPVQNRLEMDFTLSNSSFSLHPVRIYFGRSQFSANGTLSNFKSPVLNGAYTGDLFGEDLTAAFLNTGSGRSGQELRGEITTTGQLHYHRSSGASFLDSIEIAGQFRSADVVYGYRNLVQNVRELRGSYQIEGGNLHVWNVAGQALGGALSGNFEMTHFSHAPFLHITANLHDAALEQLTHAANQISHEQTARRALVHLAGQADVAFNAVGHGARDLQMHARISIRHARQKTPALGEIPVAGIVDVNYNNATDVASFGHSWIMLGSTRAELNGTLGRRAQLHVTLTTQDLHQLAQVAQMFSRSGPEHPRTMNSSFGGFNFESLGGSAQFNGTISGSLKQPQITGLLTAHDFHADGMSWRDVNAKINVSSSHAAFPGVRLANNTQSWISFHGQIGLRDWSFTPQSQIELSAALHGIPLSEIEQVMNRQEPVSGVLNANLSISGTRARPSGNGKFQITKVEAWNEAVKSVSGNFQLNNGSLSADAAANLPAGEISAKLTYSLTSKSFQASLNAPGIDLSQIQSPEIARLGLGGRLTASASAHGTIAQPHATATLAVDQLVVRGESIAHAQAQLQLNGRQMNFTLSASQESEQARAAGEVTLAGEYSAHATLDIRALALGPLLASYSSSARGLQGQLEIHATVNGPLKNLSAIQAHISIPQLNLHYDSAQLSLARPLIADYSHGVATVSPTELTGTGTDLKIQGRIPVKSVASATLSLNGEINLAALHLLGPEVKSSGKVEIHVAAHGIRSLADSLEGQIRVVNASLFTSNVPVGLENLNTTLDIANGRLSIAQFAAEVGGGTLNAAGSLGLSRMAPFNITLQGNRIRLRYPAGIRSVISANLRFNGTFEASELAGRVTLDRLSFTQQFDLSSIMGQFSGMTGGSNPSQFAQHMKLNLTLESARELQLATSQVSMAGTANLNIVGTAANPVILGRMTLESGDVFFMGKRYEVQSGTITFANPARTEPVVNVYVTTTVNQYHITMNFVGPVERLRTNYTSVPPLSPADIINLLAFGKTTEEAAAQTSTPASLGAESLVAQGVGNALSSRLQNLTGLSQLSISPTIGSNQYGAGAQVALQERVTGSLLVTLSTDTAATQNTAVQVRYNLTPILSVSVLRDRNGGYALDFRVRRTF